jgi:hypothetical protein
MSRHDDLGITGDSGTDYTSFTFKSTTYSFRDYD